MAIDPTGALLAVDNNVSETISLYNVGSNGGLTLHFSERHLAHRSSSPVCGVLHRRVGPVISSGKIAKGDGLGHPPLFCGMFDPSKPILIEKISRMAAELTHAAS
jgi:hypothetical protein